jgi:hypothetical protein
LQDTSTCDSSQLEKEGILWLQNREKIFEERYVSVVGIQLKISTKKEGKETLTLSLFNFKLEKLDNWTVSRKNQDGSIETLIGYVFTLEFENNQYTFATSSSGEYSDWLDLFNLFELRNFASTQPVNFLTKTAEMELRLNDEYKLILEEKKDFEKFTSEKFSFENLESIYHQRIMEIQSGKNL